MFYIYRTLSSLNGHLRPSYQSGAFRTNDASRIGEILKRYLGQAIRHRVLTTYFFKESLKHNTKVITYALRYDPPIRVKGDRNKAIRGFVEIEQVSFVRYCKVKLARFWSYWIKNNTPADASEIFPDAH